MAYEAKIVLDSVSEAGVRLTTMEVTFPRMVLAEFNTHRVFSRNSASSRAIPFAKQVARIKQDPFIPFYWGANQKGMQAEGEIAEAKREVAKLDWLRGRDYAIDVATELDELGLHKQTINRLLEPFMWHTVIVTATEWSNFFALRANADAQPEIREIAERMQALYQESQPEIVSVGDWHMPYIQPDEAEWVSDNHEEARKVSAARCARVSYLTHDGVRDHDADLKLYDRLVGGGHMSPLEHVATPHDLRKYPTGASWFEGNFRGWRQLRKLVPCEDDFSKTQKR